MTSSSSISEKTASSSISKASLTLLCGGGCALAAAIVGLAHGEFVLAVLAALAAIGSAWSWIRSWQSSASIGKAIDAVSTAADGHLRAQIIGIRGRGDLGRLLVGINQLLDQFEAFGKEADAAMMAAEEKRFYRKIQLKGYAATSRPMPNASTPPWTGWHTMLTSTGSSPNAC